MKVPRFPLPIRLLNWVGGRLDAAGLWYRLDQEDLLKAARKKTGLEDFGEGEYLSKLRRLIQAINIKQAVGGRVDSRDGDVFLQQGFPHSTGQPG